MRIGKILWSVILLQIAMAGGAVRAAEMVIQRGHEGQASGIAISADGRYLATAGLGDPIKLWQHGGAEFVRDLPDSSEELPLAWSPDGRVLLTSARDVGYAQSRATGGVKVRAIPSGKVLRRISGVTTPLYFDGRTIRCTDGNAVSVWRLADGARLSITPLEKPRPKRLILLYNPGAPPARLTEGSLINNGAERFYAFSPNGRYLIFGGYFGEYVARVWDARTGRLLHELSRSQSAFDLAAVSNDGQWAVTQGESATWQPPDSAATESAYAREYQLHLWSLRTEKVVASWRGYYSLSGGVTFLRFSQDGRLVYSGGDDHGFINAVPSGKLVRPVEVQRYQSMSADERFWASAYIENYGVVSVASGKVIRRCPGSMYGGSSLRWSPDGRLLSAGGFLRIWDLEHARMLKLLKPDWAYLTNSRWRAPDLLQTENLQEATYWRIDSSRGGFERELAVVPAFPPKSPGSSGYSDYVWVSPDGNLMLTGPDDYSERGLLYLWAKDGKTILRKFRVLPDNKILHSVTWFPDNEHILVPTQDGLGIWRVSDGTKVLTIPPLKAWPKPTESYHDLTVLPEAISPDGKYLVGSPAIGGAEVRAVWSLDWGELPTAHLEKEIPTRGPVSFSPDGERMLIGPEIWKWKTGERAAVVLSRGPESPDASSVQQLAGAWSPDGRLLALGGTGALQIYDASSGRHLAQLSFGTAKNDRDDTRVESIDWLIWTDDGYFSAPDRGQKRVRWRENGVLLPFGSARDCALRNKFFRPDLVSGVLLGTRKG